MKRSTEFCTASGDQPATWGVSTTLSRSSSSAGGAGLDVYESEPAPPAELLDLDNVVLTPHVAGWSPEAVQNSVDRFMENARRHLAGEAPVTPL